MVDLLEKRLEKARQMGADMVIHSGKEDVRKIVGELNGGEEESCLWGLP